MGEYQPVEPVPRHSWCPVLLTGTVVFFVILGAVWRNPDRNYVPIEDLTREMCRSGQYLTYDMASGRFECVGNFEEFRADCTGSVNYLDGGSGAFTCESSGNG